MQRACLSQAPQLKESLFSNSVKGGGNGQQDHGEEPWKFLYLTHCSKLLVSSWNHRHTCIFFKSLQLSDIFTVIQERNKMLLQEVVCASWVAYLSVISACLIQFVFLTSSQHLALTRISSTDPVIRTSSEVHTYLWIKLDPDDA